jgi:hypothetical protein
MPRGVITYRKRALQINDFSGLIRHRGITPTDIDGFIDYAGVAFLFMEGKHTNAKIPLGQKLSFKHLCDAIINGGRLACAIIYTHNTGVEQDVDVANCMVKEAYWAGKWRLVADRTVKQFIESYEDYAEMQGFKI